MSTSSPSTTMRLQLSVWAEDLPTSLMGGAPEVYCCVTHMAGSADGGNILLGKSESLVSASPDWTKLFYLEDFSFGQTVNLVVSMYHAKTKKSLGSTLFEVNSILGKPGSVFAKELKKGGGMVAVHAEPASKLGQLTLQLRGLNLLNTEGHGLLRKSDPYFGFQALRTSVSTGSRVWDTLYRSDAVQNNLSPVWRTVSLEVSALTGGSNSSSSSLQKRIRLVVYDANENGKDDFMGYRDISIQELIDATTETALADVDRIDMDKAFELVKNGKPAGHLLVAKAEVTGVPIQAAAEEPAEPEPEVPAEELPPPEETLLADEPEVVFEPEPNYAERAGATFLDYVRGGCELRAAIAVDATASNGDPREGSSLHHFNRGHNHYEQALFETVSILSEYDSDQQYPVYGFGLKQNGVVQHAWPFAKSAKGVEGVLEAYNATMRSGIVMSQPRDLSEVIITAAKSATVAMEKSQSYSILLIFTNGMPEDLTTTATAFQACDTAPLSIVLIGVGPERLDQSALAYWNSGRSKVSMIQFPEDNKDSSGFAKEALSHIPEQVVEYMSKKNIKPIEESAETEQEVEVAAYDSEDDVEVSIDEETGQVTTTAVAAETDAEVQEEEATDTKVESETKEENEDEDAFQKRLAKMRARAKRAGKRAKKRFGRVRGRARRRVAKLKNRLRGDD